MRRRQDIPFPVNGFESWGGYMKTKIAKLEEQFSHDIQTEVTKESNIFSGISIFVNGYTKPSSDELKLLMSQHGGTFHTYLRTGIDFIIASNLPDTKVKRLTTSKIVKPEWIVESIAAGQLLDYKNYLLYSKNTRTQPRLKFHNFQSNPITSEASYEDEYEVNNKVLNPNVMSVHQKENEVKKKYGDERKLGKEEVPKENRLLELSDDNNMMEDNILSSNISNSGSNNITNTKADDAKLRGLSESSEVKTDPTNSAHTPHDDMFYESSNPVEFEPFEKDFPTINLKLKNNEIVSNIRKASLDVLGYTKKLSPYLNDEDMFENDITITGSQVGMEHSGSYTFDVANSYKPNIRNEVSLLRQDNRDIPTSISSKESQRQIISNVSKVREMRKDNIPPDKDANGTVVNPNFLSEFYNNSRLHHISQLGAAFKQYINDLRQASNFQFPKRNLLIKTGSDFFKHNPKHKIIMHIDMDCFFVSVGLRKHPSLKGLPVAVTHAKSGASRPPARSGVQQQTEFDLHEKRLMDKVLKGTFNNNGKVASVEGNIPSLVDGKCEQELETGEFESMSEIASCSYEARVQGVKNGMFMGAARRLCPNLKTIPYDFDGYKEVAYILYETIAQYTLDIEAVSCDELYADCTELLSGTGLTVDEFATTVRREIYSKTGCPCSTGFGSNRLQARMATKKAKPNSQYHLSEENVLEYFHDIPVGDLPGVGRQMKHKLSALNFTTCGDLRNSSLPTLQKHFGGKTGQQLYHQCRGGDVRPLSFVTKRKSVSAEVNYGIRFEDHTHCEIFLEQLCEEVHRRLEQSKVIGRAVTLKLMVRARDAPIEPAKFMGHGFCDNLTKTSTLNKATDDLSVITKEVTQIFKKLNVDPKEMRGIGIQITKLEAVKDSGTKQNKGSIWNQFQKIEKSKNVESQNECHNNETTTNVGINKAMNISNDGKSEDQNKQNNLCQNIQSNNHIIKVNMYENIVALQETPIKNTIMSDFLKGEKSSEKRDHVMKSVKVNLPSSISKLNLENSPAVGKASSAIFVASPAKKKSVGVPRKRGRPPKHAALQEHKAARAGVSGPGKMDNFLNTKSHQRHDEILDLSGLDASVLAALPQDIRQEVLEQHQREKRNKTPRLKTGVNVNHNTDTNNHKLQIDEAFLAELPEALQREIVSEYKASYKMNQPKKNNIHQKKPTPKPIVKTDEKMKPEISSSTEKDNKNSDILSLPWKRIREMLREWLGSEIEPLRCDSQLMSSYMQYMVWNRDIDHLMILVHFLHRTVREKGVCAWHAAYVHMMEGVQRSMLDVYGRRLMAPCNFPCCSQTAAATFSTT